MHQQATQMQYRIAELEQQVAAQQARIAELREVLRATTEGLEWRWESIANRAAPLHETAIDEAHTKGIEALMVKDDLSALNDLKARYEARIQELREALSYGPQRLEALKARDLNCGCDHNEYCDKCFPPEFQSGGRFFAMPEQVMREVLDRNDDLSALEAVKRQARREALLEAADLCGDLAIRDWLESMAGEVK